MAAVFTCRGIQNHLCGLYCRSHRTGGPKTFRSMYSTATVGQNWSADTLLDLNSPDHHSAQRGLGRGLRGPQLREGSMWTSTRAEGSRPQLSSPPLCMARSGEGSAWTSTRVEGSRPQLSSPPLCTARSGEGSACTCTYDLLWLCTRTTMRAPSAFSTHEPLQIAHNAQ